MQERDLHLKVVVEGERQQRQLFSLFKEKSAKELRGLQEQVARQQASDADMAELRSQNDQLISSLAITRSQGWRWVKMVREGKGRYLGVLQAPA